MSRYKVTLKPLHWFFFGGEETFDNGETQSFIARSNRFPQQTTLLGMVRYQLLKQNHLLLNGEKRDESTLNEMAILIGKESFDIEATETQSFGKIKSISPVFIQMEGHQLVPMPLTHGLDISFTEGVVWLNGFLKNKIINAPSFDEKKYDNYCKLIDENGKTSDIDTIFTSDMQIGITKADGGDENEKGFYKQEILCFKNKDTSYAFFLELEDGTKLDNDFVFIGAQRSCFKMEVKKSDDTLFVPEHPAKSILLISPTYITDHAVLDANCLQLWSGTTNFRNLQQNAQGKLRSGAISYHRHSSLCTFLTAGSVIFYQDTNQLDMLKNLLDCKRIIDEETKETKENNNLKNIGYNHYNVNN